MFDRIACAALCVLVGTAATVVPAIAGAPAKFVLTLVDPPAGQPPYHSYLFDGWNGGNLRVPGGPFRLWFEIGLEGWDPDQNGPLLASWQLTLDTSTVVAGQGAIGLAVEPCVSDGDCEDAFGSGSTCADPPGNPQFCTPGFQDLNRCGWAFDSSPPVAAPFGTFSGTTSMVGPVADTGARLYGGTIVLDVSPDARGLFELVLAATAGQMSDFFSQPIPVEVPPGLDVLVPVGACCKCPPTGVDVCLELTQFECEALPSRRDRIEPISDCTSISICANCISNAACGDFNACTQDICTACSECTHSLTYDVATQCCNPTNGQKVALSDGNGCTTDVCDTQTGLVTHAPMATGSPCDDGDPCTTNTTCNASGQCRGAQYTGPGCPINRYLGFDVSDVSVSGCLAQHAIRVTFVDIAGFPAHNGEVRWVGAPADYPVGATPTPTYKAAPLVCTPHFSDWTSLGLVHTFGAGVLPGSTYLLELVEPSCDDLNDPACYFGSLVIDTANWGDVSSPFVGPANFIDISAIIAAFQLSAGAPAKPRAHLAANVPSPGAAITFLDVSACVDAFKGFPPPYLGPTACP